MISLLLGPKATSNGVRSCGFAVVSDFRVRENSLVSTAKLVTGKEGSWHDGLKRRRLPLKAPGSASRTSWRSAPPPWRTVRFPARSSKDCGSGDQGWQLKGLDCASTIVKLSRASGLSTVLSVVRA